MRSDMIKRLVYSAQKIKSGKSVQIDIATIREGRLKNINSGLLESIVAIYNTEKESTMATCINLSVHLLDSRKRENSFWEDITIRTSLITNSNYE